MRYGLSHHLKTICIVCGFIQCSRQIIFESCLQDTSTQPPYLLSLQIYTTCKTWSFHISFYRILKPCFPSKVVDTILVPAGMYHTSTYTGIKTPTFRTGLNTGHVLAIPVDFEQYQPIPGVPAGTEKKLFLFIYFF